MRSLYFNLLHSYALTRHRSGNSSDIVALLSYNNLLKVQLVILDSLLKIYNSICSRFDTDSDIYLYHKRSII